jgi:putative acyl-CoA dehydrogenase
VARLAVEKLALLAASASLNRVSPHHTELFAASRLATAHAGMYGAIDLSEPDTRGLLERALPWLHAWSRRAAVDCAPRNEIVIVLQ